MRAHPPYGPSLARLVATKPLLILLSALTLFVAISTGVDASSNVRGLNPTLDRRYLQTYKSLFTNSSAPPDRPPSCPPCPEPDCFNCQLPAYECYQYGECNQYDGLCSCPVGFGGPDCLSPLCGSPADGSKRFPKGEPGDDKSCQCSEGWEGLNCNVCNTDAACSNFLLGGERLGENGTCYDGGATIQQSFQQCDVTNKKIVDMLPGRPPQVTFSCDKSDATCNFQFWIGGRESFYCGLDDCQETIEIGSSFNKTSYDCKKVSCQCIPDRMLCGESGSIDISEFLTEEIKGPGKMSCKADADGVRRCRFEEPGMNGLISDVFGDEAIFITCKSGECIHYSQVPGYQVPIAPEKPVTWVVISAIAAILLVVVSISLLWMLGRHYKDDEVRLGSVRLPEEEVDLMKDHIPAALHWENVGYRIGSRALLDGITGSVQPGEVMAIVGASGAGKTTFLDILARREKRGVTSGTVLINGRTMSNQEYKRVVGFVDQEDLLMETLTVYETVLYSALLRLPRDMSLEAKKFRTLETMQELGILGIKDSRIGGSGFTAGGSKEGRGISGGEKRRVSIACELVTSPSILFCDEPTSGLDAYNAFNVVQSLVTLAKTYKRTVIFSIHQPRSNIVALFDKLLLLAEGRVVYSGPFSRCSDYFDQVGHPCPPGFNIADFLIDLTARRSVAAGGDAEDDVEGGGSSGSTHQRNDTSIVTTGTSSRDESTELRTRPNSIADDGSSRGGLRKKTSRLSEGLRNAFANGQSNGKDVWMPALSSGKLVHLVNSFAESDVANTTKAELDAFLGRRPEGVVNDLPDLADESTVRGSYKKAGLWTQFKILSGRAFKNLYRDPILMFAHFGLAIVLALFCGVLYHGVTNDIAGFQNRLGLFFFILSLFGFSCLTSLGVFANERALFVRERSNGYYSPLTYFTSKLLFDILPLRVVPPFLFGGCVYFLVGLVPGVAEFWKFILTLVLFSLAASSAVFFISIAVRDTGLANLVGSLTMLFSLLFAGLLINRDRIPGYLRWLQHLSFFHAAYEALIVNELRNLSLKEHKYGIDIEVPAASIISSFGFNSQAFWFPDIVTLAALFVAFTVLSLVWLVMFVRERK
ncbi:related to ABC transporter protein [Sporisorium reilianum f. sp. reilianum]|uniref:Related to ABC transporter protein n=1 Tax=Sporisorium reilianum f. sp. reilianum TaxID=72559 RepID=A0A2N8UAN0_9BASI|nr:related to ABC transporter protein [Sporisorium reilianum f. sp. reilianum]